MTALDRFHCTLHLISLSRGLFRAPSFRVVALLLSEDLAIEHSHVEDLPSDHQEVVQSGKLSEEEVDKTNGQVDVVNSVVSETVIGSIEPLPVDGVVDGGTANVDVDVDIGKHVFLVARTRNTIKQHASH